jgi:two-component system response regulator
MSTVNPGEGPSSEREFTILLVEDNPDHIELIKRAINGTPLNIHIYASTDGEDALNYVFKKGKYKSQNYPSPDLILLDIKLPKVDGYSVLETVRAEKDYQKIPIMVLTTSARDEDIQRMLKRGATSYLTKPSHYKEFLAIQNKIKNALTNHALN